MMNGLERDRLITEGVQEVSLQTTTDTQAMNENAGNIAPDPENQSHVSFLRETSTRKKFLISTLATLRFLESACASIPFPFFARLIVNQGGSLMPAATILQIRMVSLVIFGPVFRHIRHKMGSKTLMFSSLLVLSVSQCFLSVIALQDDIKHIAITGLFLRFTYGAAKAGLIVSICTVSEHEFNGHANYLQGIYHCASACGYFAGPIFGGFLYDNFGMFLPVLLSGCLMGMFLPLLYLVLESYPYSQEDRNGSLDLAKRLNAVFVTSIILVSFEYGIIGYLEVALTTYFEDLKLSVSAAGVGLGLEAGAATVSSIIVRRVCRKYPLLQRFGINVTAILYSSVMFLFSENQNISVVFAGCILLAAVGSFVHVAVFREIVTNSTDDNSNEGSDSVPLVDIAEFYIVCVSLAMFIVPSIVCLIQVFIHYATFSDAFFYLSFVNLAFAVLQGVSTFVWNCMMYAMND